MCLTPRSALGVNIHSPLHAVLKDPYLINLFTTAIPLHHYTARLTSADIRRQAHGEPYAGCYTFSKDLAEVIFTDFKRLAMIIHCAVNNYNPFEDDTGIPLTYPPSVLKELDLRKPLPYYLFLGIENPFARVYLPTEDMLRTAYSNIQTIARSSVNLVAALISRSLVFGLGTNVNWLAFFGGTTFEFVARATPEQINLPAARVQEILRSNQVFDTFDPYSALIIHPTASSAAARAKKAIDQFGGGPVNYYKGPLTDEEHVSLMAPFSPYYPAFSYMYMMSVIDSFLSSYSAEHPPYKLLFDN